MVTDQHAESLGGVQVSLRIQRKFLARMGHRMTIVAPELHRPYEPDDSYINQPSRPITKDREYGLSWPGKRADRFVRSALQHLPQVDVVHIQGDFWGALTGYRIARWLRVPVVHTMHNNVYEGTRAVTQLAPIVFWGLNVWRRVLLGPTRSRQRGAWRYLASLAERATVVTAPSAHFAGELIEHQVARQVEITPTGVDDDVISAILARVGDRPERPEPTLVWLGRMSHEKRIMQFLKAIKLAGVDARFELFGSGLLSDEVSEYIASNGLAGKVIQHGAVRYEEALAAIARADALVQTSIGFETQGMTVFEASALGTPCVISDPNIADDLATDICWRVADASIAALAEAIREAVLTLHEQAVRVPEREADAFRQTNQMKPMLAAYQAALGTNSLPE